MGEGAGGEVSEASGLQAALSATTRAEAKVASAVSTAVATRLKTKFLILIILFIRYVVTPSSSAHPWWTASGSTSARRSPTGLLPR